MNYLESVPSSMLACPILFTSPFSNPTGAGEGGQGGWDQHGSVGQSRARLYRRSPFLRLIEGVLQHEGRFKKIVAIRELTLRKLLLFFEAVLIT